MQAIRGRQTMRVKPRFGARLDPRNPLTPHILGAWTFSEGGGVLTRDSARGRLGTLTNGPTWTQGSSGESALLLDGSNDYVSTPAIPTSYVTILARARADGSAGAGGGDIVGIAYDGSSVPFMMTTRYDGASVHNGFAFYDGTWHSTAISLHQEGTGWHDFAGTFDGVNLRYIIDSVQHSTSTVSARTLPTSNTNPIAIGYYDRYFLGAIEYVYILNRALSIEEVAAFHADPYAVFSQPVWRRYYIPAGGGGGASEAAAGVVAGVSTVSGSLSATVPIVGASAGVSAVGGTVRATVAITAASAGTSTVAGTVTVAAGVAGASAGVSTVGGTLSSTVPVSAATAGVSAVSGAVRATVVVLGAVAGVSAVGGAASATVPISAASAGVSTVGGTLAGQGQELAIGAVAGVSTVSGTLRAIVPVQAVSAAVSTASGSLTVEGQAGADEAVAGATAGVSTAAGTLSVQIQAAASTSGTSGLAAALRSFRIVAGAAASVSTVSANLSGGEELLPAIRAASSDGSYGAVVATDRALSGVTADRVLMGATASDSEG